MELHLENVDKIFHTHNIYKSVLVCERRKLREMKRALLARDFPVATVDQVAKFVTSNDRILLLSPEDARNIELVLGKAQHVKEQLSLLICVRSTKFNPDRQYWEGIPVFFV